MKKLTYILLAGLAILSIASCNKTNTDFQPTASLMMVNTVVGGATLTLGTSAITVANNASVLAPIYAGQTPVSLATAATATVPSVSYYNQTIPTVNSGNYSLFLAGASPSAVDAVLITENYKNYTDSLCGVRFINLAPGSNPVSVNIKGSANGSEASSLAYKAYTDFKQYPAKKVNTSYIFEIRNASTGTLITSYTMTTLGFLNVTIALRGLVNGSPSAGVTLVKHP